MLSSLIDGKPSQVVNQPNRLKRNGNHLADEANDVLGIVGAVRVVDDVGALVGRDAVLINDRFEGAAIAEAVFVDFGRDAAEGEEGVVLELSLVLRRAFVLSCRRVCWGTVL